MSGREKDDSKHRLRGQEIKETHEQRREIKGRGCNLVSLRDCLSLHSPVGPLALARDRFTDTGHCAGNIYENLHK